MKVILLQTSAGPKGVWLAGSKIDVDKATGERLIKERQAKPA